MKPESVTQQPPAQLTEAEVEARRRRNVALAGALFAFVALIFVITIVRFYMNVHHGL